MSDYKLTYFNGLGLGEIIRLIFVAADVKFEDVQVTHEQWPALKPSFPGGTIPNLETGGQMYFQSLAIARYLARKFGLVGKTELDEFKVNIVVDTLEDALRPIGQFFDPQGDDKKKQELKNTYMNETLPKALSIVEKLLKANKNGDGYFVGDSLTWADLHLLDFVPRIELIVKTKVPLEKYPKLKALFERVSSQPKIAKWIAKRPPSDF